MESPALHWFCISYTFTGNVWQWVSILDPQGIYTVLILPLLSLKLLQMDSRPRDILAHFALWRPSSQMSEQQGPELLLGSTLPRTALSPGWLLTGLVTSGTIWERVGDG